MALPKIAVPEFKTIIPSTKEEVYFRPFSKRREATSNGVRRK